MNFSGGPTGLPQAAAAPTTNINCTTRLIFASSNHLYNVGERAKLVPETTCVWTRVTLSLLTPEYVPKPRRVSIGRRGAYIATSKEEPQR